MPGHDIVVIGASAGGVEAVSALVRELPADLPASLFLVHHFPAYATSVLPQILNRAGRLDAAHAIEHEPIRQGRIYVAPPDRHLLIRAGHVLITNGPRENGHRPAIDPLFRTAARAYGPRVVGVILSGTLDDGTAGLLTVKKYGGIALVQDPQDASFPGMPLSAIENVKVDRVLPISGLAEEIDRLARDDLKSMEGNVEEEDQDVRDVAEYGVSALKSGQYPGPPSALTCPECGGALWELNEGELLRYRCHVGHGYSAEALINAQNDEVEAALWSALRALEENAEMSRRLAERANRRGHAATAGRFEQQSMETEDRARLVRNLLTRGRFQVAANGLEQPKSDRDEARGKVKEASG